MKRCLTGWVNGSYNFRTKMSAHDANKLSEWLELSNSYFPSEATRNIRPLTTISYWKSIEYRTFLLYLGPVALKGIISAEAYNHFLHLSVAVSIFSCEKYVANPTKRSVAAKLLDTYVEIFKDLYGEDSISHNVHNLVHNLKIMELYQIFLHIHLKVHCIGSNVC